MPDVLPSDEISVEVLSPDGSRQLISVTQSPFFIGRGDAAGNHLQLSDRRISRRCAVIIGEGGSHEIQDLGHRHGVFVNGERIQRKVLANEDLITFGLDDSYKLRIRKIGSAADAALQTMLIRLPEVPKDEASSGLGKLSLLLEATSLLHSQLPLDSVLATMLDHAIAVTNADRGILLEPDSSGELRVRLARGQGGTDVPRKGLNPSQTALRHAIEQQSSVITEDLNVAAERLQAAHSIISQRLRAVIAVPLYAKQHADAQEYSSEKQLLGVVYLDSRRPTAFSKLDRQILDALSVEAASILDNARLVEKERERQRIEQELSIARQIQQALVPRGFRDFPYFSVTGVHKPCLDVGGDYFDVFPISDDRTAILIADVSGKGLGAALVTTILQGALSGMTLGVNPARVFNHINRFLCEHVEVARYATMFFGILDRDGRLEFINAGHLPPVLVRDGVTTDIAGSPCLPVGLFDEAEYVDAQIKLEPGDTLALFTDGITEAMNGAQEMYGVDRLREALSSQSGATLEETEKSILKSLEQFVGGADQNDDVTLLLVRYRSNNDTAGAETKSRNYALC